MIAALASDPEFYRTKLNSALLMAPAANLHNMRNSTIIEAADPNSNSFKAIVAGNIDKGKMFEEPYFKNSFTANVAHGVSDFFLEANTDENTEFMQSDKRITMFAHLPAGTSMRNVDHLR